MNSVSAIFTVLGPPRKGTEDVGMESSLVSLETRRCMRYSGVCFPTLFGGITGRTRGHGQGWGSVPGATGQEEAKSFLPAVYLVSAASF